LFINTLAIKPTSPPVLNFSFKKTLVVEVIFLKKLKYKSKCLCNYMIK